MGKNNQVSDGFKAVIKAYLDNRAAEDELFAKTYAKANKSINGCCNYIIDEVRKSGRTGFADDEIYGMAVHYYDEDDIKDITPVSAKVVVNHTIELSDSEKAEAIEAAKEEFKKRQLAKLEADEQSRKEREQKRHDAKVKAAAEKREREGKMQLDLFGGM